MPPHHGKEEILYSRITSTILIMTTNVGYIIVLQLQALLVNIAIDNVIN
jgi:hypothetical protein